MKCTGDETALCGGNCLLDVLRAEKNDDVGSPTAPSSATTTDAASAVSVVSNAATSQINVMEMSGGS
jgi:hypothetical protein